MAVTIKDVANLAGVSPSTVSRTCNNHPSISRETKEKVRKAMAQLGYEPAVSPAALNTDGFSYRSIGVILPPSEKEAYENSFYLEVMRGISQFCNKRGYIASVITGADENEIISAISAMNENNVISGFIVMFSQKDNPIISYLYDEGLTYVLIGNAFSNANQTVYVDNDNISAGHDATAYLCSLGHRRIAYLGSSSSLIFSADRHSGYLLALAESGIVPDRAYTVELNSVSDAAEPIRALLKSDNPPTAVVVSDDIFALALERVCMEEGIDIPRDLSIVSFNNSIFASLTSAQLTTVDINSFQLGIEAASQAINHIENPNLMATKIIVPHSIIERKSVTPISE